jgi:hypothetical protein
MRQGKVLFICMLCSLSYVQATWAQNPLMSQARAPRVGDTLYYQTDELPHRIIISPPGQDQLWNFTSLLAPFLQTEIVAGSNEQIMVGQQDDQKDTYEVQEDGLIWKRSSSLVVGKTQINHLWQSEEGIPLPSWEMAYQEDRDFEALYSCTFSAGDAPRVWQKAIPAGTDSLKVLLLINRSMTADATGMLMLTGGSRHSVQRIRVEDLVNKKLMGKKNGSWADIGNSSGLTDLLPEKTLSYQFISKQGGGTVCNVKTDQSGKPTLVQFSIPKEQAALMKKLVPSQWLFAYPNPALSVVRFKFLDVPAGRYVIRFYDILLRNLLEKEYQVSGDETVEININHLVKGTYLFSLIDENGKKVVTKRLIVIKP